MDELNWALWTSVGILVGLVTGLIPGLHVNTLAALALVAGPALGAQAAVALVAIATVHAFVQILPTTYLGAPGEDGALSTLPAHRLLLQGRAPEAVRVTLDAALWGLVAAIAFILPFKWVLDEPGRLLSRLDEWMPLVVLAVCVLLVLQERHRGAKAMAWAALVLGLSGLLGLVSLRLIVSPLVAVPGTPLLPLLSGLFGVAGLLVAASHNGVVPAQHPPSRRLAQLIRRRVALGTWLGIAAAAWTAAMPGLTSAVASAVARAGCHDEDPRPVLATLSAVNTAHLGFSFAMLWVFLRPRTGLALATQAFLPIDRWTSGAAPRGLDLVLLTALVAATAGAMATRLLDRPFARIIPRIPARPLAGTGVALIVAIVAVLAGWMGLAILATATVVGLVPLAVGVRRVHLTGALLLPVLALRWIP